MSKVRNSLTPSSSISTATRPAEAEVEIKRAFGQRNNLVGCDHGAAAAEHPIADHGSHCCDREHHGERRDQHDDPRAGHHLRRRGLGGLVCD